MSILCRARGSTRVHHGPLAVLVAFGVALAAPFGSAHAEALVIASTLSAIAPGSTLTDTATFDVPAGGRLTLLLADGRTEVIEGPRQGRVGDLAAGKAADSSLWNTVKALVTTKGGTSSRPGATRSAAPTKTAPPRAFDLADIPPTASGRWCVPAGTRPTFTRRAIANDLRLTLHSEGGHKGEVHFPAGVATAAWPAAVPVGSGRVTIGQAALPARSFELRIMAGRPDRAGLLAALLAERCEGQARLWLRDLAAAGPR